MMTRFMIAAIFGLMLTAGSLEAGGDAARGKELSIDCADCHGEDGRGDAETPALAGMDEAKHIAALKAFKSGEREDEEGMMAMYAEDLSEQDMADLAAYYATLDGE